MNTDQILFFVDLNERRSDSTNLVWSVMAGVNEKMTFNTKKVHLTSVHGVGRYF